MTDVDLAFDAGARKSFFLVGGVKINAAVGTRLRHYIDFQFEIFEGVRIANIKDMRGLPARYECSVFNLPRVRVVDRRLPTVERFVIENRCEAVVRIRRA